MKETAGALDDFLSQITDIIEKNISNEQFGVSELAEQMNMSRSNLLRKVKKDTGKSVSQFIRQIRLEIAMEMLKETTVTVSEVSYKVGFGSTSYFIKCFREHYGHSPGEVGERKHEPLLEEEPKPKGMSMGVVVFFSILVLSILSFLVYNYWPEGEEELQTPVEKSIAVLPFKNESSDSSNVYFINGLMESTLSNLQKIEDLRVISRTSTEKYRDSDKSIPEIAEELNVNYFVEGSGQKVGDKVLLHIQLIEASSDKHLWAGEYNKEIADIFSLQGEISKMIADAVEAIVTPEEIEQIEKVLTENVEAYDYYLQGLDHFNYRSGDGLDVAIPLFEKAIELDPEFSEAYAHIAIAYYFKDIYQVEKLFVEEINNFADQALLYDSRSDISLLAKAFYYMHTKEYRLAVPHLEKALEYNPNSSGVVQTLSDLYARYIPNSAKYLEYALKGIQLEIQADDSISRSYLYLHLSNAFIQTGFVEEAYESITKSLDYNPNNEFGYVRAYIMYARDSNIENTKRILFEELSKDNTRLDIVQEVGKIYYYQKNYDSAAYYYSIFDQMRTQYGLDIFPNEDIKIGWSYEQVGRMEDAQRMYASYDKFCETDVSIYHGALMAAKYVREGDIDRAIEQLRDFSNQDNLQYWIVLFLEMDPLIQPMGEHPEYAQIVEKIKVNFWEDQSKLRESLEAKGLL